MKVKELIEELNKLPQEATIGAFDLEDLFVNDMVYIYSKTDTCSAKCRSKKNLLKSKTDKRGTTKLKSGKFIGQASFMGKKYHTSVCNTDDEAHQARNLLIEKIIKEN